ncbi:hypothetical protein J6590_103638 [Homalodisca vitripennis]|nr:hypothetical protein J6590_103638 [Homalodisca vitripennis]
MTFQPANITLVELVPVGNRKRAMLRYWGALLRPLLMGLPVCWGQFNADCCELPTPSCTSQVGNAEEIVHPFERRSPCVVIAGQDLFDDRTICGFRPHPERALAKPVIALGREEEEGNLRKCLHDKAATL